MLSLCTDIVNSCNCENKTKNEPTASNVTYEEKYPDENQEKAAKVLAEDDRNRAMFANTKQLKQHFIVMLILSREPLMATRDQY